MGYIRPFWESTPEGEPPITLHEVDTEHERLAFSSIDTFADGRTHNIPDLCDRAIEVTPTPTAEEFNAHAWGGESHTCLVEKTEFKAVWKSHTHNRVLEQSGGV